MHHAPWFAVLLATGCQHVFGADLRSDAGTIDATDAPPRLCTTGRFDLDHPITSMGIDNPAVVKVGKFSGDGVLDLALTSLSLPGVTLARSEGDGSFSVSGSYASSVNRRGTSLVVGDLDLDNDDDLVMGTSSIAVETYRIDGDGVTPNDYGAGVGAVVPALVDFNGDNRVDLAVASTGGDLVQMMPQGMAFGFNGGSGVEVGKGPKAIAVLNLDATSDAYEIVTANSGEDTITILNNHDAGVFVATAVVVGPSPGVLATGLVDADGLPDLVVAKPFEQLELIPATSTSELSRYSIDVAGATITSVEVADVDGDGLGEMVVLDAGAATIHILKPSVPLTASFDVTQAQVPVAANAVAMVLGDFTADDWIDLVLVLSSGDIMTYPNCR